MTFFMWVFWFFFGLTLSISFLTTGAARISLFIASGWFFLTALLIFITPTVRKLLITLVGN